MTTQTVKASSSTPAKPADKPKEVEPVSPTPPARRPVSADEIRLRAYLSWEAAGKPPGDDVIFWLKAEKELLQGK